MPKPRIYSYFGDADPMGRLPLNSVGATEDIETQRVELADGLEIEVYDEEHAADAVVRASEDHRHWYAIIDWNRLRPNRSNNT